MLHLLCSSRFRDLDPLESKELLSPAGQGSRTPHHPCRVQSSPVPSFRTGWQCCFVVGELALVGGTSSEPHWAEVRAGHLVVSPGPSPLSGPVWRLPLRHLNLQPAHSGRPRGFSLTRHGERSPIATFQVTFQFTFLFFFLLFFSKYFVWHQISVLCVSACKPK